MSLTNKLTPEELEARCKSGGSLIDPDMRKAMEDATYHTLGDTENFGVDPETLNDLNLLDGQENDEEVVSDKSKQSVSSIVPFLGKTNKPGAESDEDKSPQSKTPETNVQTNNQNTGQGQTSTNSNQEKEEGKKDQKEDNSGGENPNNEEQDDPHHVDMLTKDKKVIYKTSLKSVAKKFKKILEEIAEKLTENNAGIFGVEETEKEISLVMLDLPPLQRVNERIPLQNKIYSHPTSSKTDDQKTVEQLKQELESMKKEEDQRKEAERLKEIEKKKEQEKNNVLKLKTQGAINSFHVQQIGSKKVSVLTAQGLEIPEESMKEILSKDISKDEKLRELCLISPKGNVIYRMYNPA